MRRRINGTDWQIVSEIPAAAVSERFERYNAILLWSTLLALIVASVAAGFVGITVSLPIRKLGIISERIGAGEYPTPGPQPLPWTPWQLAQLHTARIRFPIPEDSG